MKRIFCCKIYVEIFLDCPKIIKYMKFAWQCNPSTTYIYFNTINHQP